MQVRLSISSSIHKGTVRREENSNHHFTSNSSSVCSAGSAGVGGAVEDREEGAVLYRDAMGDEGAVLYFEAKGDDGAVLYLTLDV
jgi:hypothetical protein